MTLVRYEVTAVSAPGMRLNPAVWRHPTFTTAYGPEDVAARKEFAAKHGVAVDVREVTAP